MYEVTFSVDGLVKTLQVPATDGVLAQTLVTNMFGTGKVQIISVRKI